MIDESVPTPPRTTSLTRRIVQLAVGLPLYGVGVALTVEAGLGLDPWTVLAEGLAIRTGLGIGWVTILIGALVLLAWIPLREKPGIGTILNIAIVGAALQVTLDLMAPLEGLAWRIAALLGGIAVVGLASGLYIGARFGPGPRDGLMTGLHRTAGWPVWRARATIELSVLALGWLLGGTVGWGTVAFAVLIGPSVGVALRLLDTHRSPAHGEPVPAAA